MLLILAGVALATLTGQGNIIGNAENAVGKYNNSVASEQQLLNEIEKYFIEHTNGGEVQDTNNPIVTATEGEEKITQGTSIEISSYFTYSANGTAEITNVTYTDTSNGDAVVANTNTLTVGTHIIKCTVTKETGAVASATKTIIVEESVHYYTVIVEDSGAENDGSGTYVAGEIVYINAGTKAGYRFDGWSSSDGVIFANSSSASTSFEMPKNDVTITAIWI